MSTTREVAKFVEEKPAEEVEPSAKASRDLLQQMIDVAKEKDYSKEEILAYAKVEKLIDLTTEQAAHIKAMTQKNEALVPEEGDIW